MYYGELENREYDDLYDVIPVRITGINKCTGVSSMALSHHNSLNKREIASTSASKAAIGVYIY